MRLSAEQIEAIKQETVNYFGVDARVRLFCSRVDDNQHPQGVRRWVPRCYAATLLQRGYTLVELIMVMVIVGIMATVVAPRFFDNNVFQSRGFADQVQASLRYAQKEAIAQHRLVCVALAATSVTLTIASTSADVTCTPPLPFPAGGNFINAPSGVTLSPAVTITFDALGRTPVQPPITVSGATNNIVVEAETGYVHSP